MRIHQRTQGGRGQVRPSPIEDHGEEVLHRRLVDRAVRIVVAVDAHLGATAGNPRAVIGDVKDAKRRPASVAGSADDSGGADGDLLGPVGPETRTGCLMLPN